MKLKKSVNDVNDPNLRKLYIQTIQVIEGNLRELLNFHPKAPNLSMPFKSDIQDPETGFFANDLLGMAKTLVRSYAIAVTETATQI